MNKNKLMKYSKEVLAEYILNTFRVDPISLERIKIDIEFKKYMNQKEEISNKNIKLLDKLSKAKTTKEHYEILLELKKLDAVYAKLDKKTNKLLNI